MTQFVPLIAIFAIFYFLVLRPQSKKAKDHQKMLSELKKGDDVSTQGGIIGRITGIKDNEVTLQKVLQQHQGNISRVAKALAKPHEIYGQAISWNDLGGGRRPCTGSSPWWPSSI